MFPRRYRHVVGGALLCMSAGAACGGDGGGTAPPELPIISNVSVTPSTDLQPGDSLTISYAVTSPVPLSNSVIHFSGAFAGDSPADHAGLMSVTRVARAAVPAAASLDVPLTITIDAYNTSGGHAQASFPSIALVDRIAPAVSFSVTNGQTTWVPGDTVRLTVTAHDNAQLTWVGYTLAGITDSVHTASADTTLSVAIQLTAAQIGSQTISAFARDRTQRVTGPLVQANVIDAVRVVTREATLTNAVREIAYDGKRGVLYLTQPSAATISVLSLSTMTFGAAITSPSAPWGLDLTQGGDSLLVTLRQTGQLGVVDLSQATRTMQTVALPVGSFLNQGPDHIAVLANNKAIVTLTFDGSGYGGSVVEYDLVTHAAKARTDAGFGASVTESVPLARSFTRRRMIMLIDDSCCPEDGQLYSTDADSFVVKRGTESSYFPSVSADSVGARFLIGGGVYDSTLTRVSALKPTDFAFGPSVLAENATVAYLGTDFGYDKVRLSDGVVLRRVLLPVAPTKLLVLPGSSTLVALGGNRVMAIDTP
jgi:hypothetical protein